MWLIQGLTQLVHGYKETLSDKPNDTTKLIHLKLLTLILNRPCKIKVEIPKYHQRIKGGSSCDRTIVEGE